MVGKYSGSGRRAPQRRAEPYLSRLERLQAAVLRAGGEALLVTNDKDQFYLTGFTGEDGAVLITRRSVWLVTDGRFEEQARHEAPWAKAVIRKGGLAEAIGRVAGRLKVRLLIVQPEHLTVEFLRQLRRHLPKGCRIGRRSGVVSRLRLLKDKREVEAIRASVRVAERAFELLREQIRLGMTEVELAAMLEYHMRRLGASGPAFPTIVAVGPNAALPHARPGARRVPKNGLVLFDWGAVVDGYCSDLTRVLLVGRIPPRIRQVYQVVLEAQLRAIEAIRPHLACRQIDAIARQVLDDAGLGRYFVHGLGHGLGLQVHEAPRLSATSRERLASGMVVTVEPGVYLPGLGGVRIEDDVLVTESGCEVLSGLGKSLQWAKC